MNIQQDPDKALKMLQETGFCFLFAQKYHAAMKYVGPIRKELGFRTVFNILGPLTNPAKPERFLLAGYLVEPLAKVLCSLGVKRAWWPIWTKSPQRSHHYLRTEGWVLSHQRHQAGRLRSDPGYEG